VTFQQKRNKGAIDPVTRSSKRDPKIIALEIPSVCLQTSLQTLNLLCLHLCAFCHACVMRVCVCIIQMCAPTLQALARISRGRNSISHRRCKKMEENKWKRKKNNKWRILDFIDFFFTFQDFYCIYFMAPKRIYDAAKKRDGTKAMSTSLTAVIKSLSTV